MYFFSFIVLSVFLAALSAQAHKLNLSAWSEDERIHGKTDFGPGSTAQNILISLYSADTEELIVETHSDTQGRFQFSLPKEGGDLLVVAEDRQGHRAEFVFTRARAVAADVSLLNPSQLESSSHLALEGEALRHVLAEEIRRELAPVQQALAELQTREADFRDILGGLGWIFGLAGLFAWLQSRKNLPNKEKSL
jgi:nickel transport protein